MTNRKFNAGDKIRHKDSGYVGTIVSGDDANGYSVRYSCDDEEYYVGKDEIDFVDAKSVFLSRLQTLLREFDAEIYGGLSDTHGDDVLFIEIGNDEIVYSNGCQDVSFAHITASNIMDFEKD